MPYRTVTNRVTVTKSEDFFADNSETASARVYDMEHSNKSREKYRANSYFVGQVDSNLLNCRLDDDIFYLRLSLAFLSIGFFLIVIFMMALFGVIEFDAIFIIITIYFLMSIFLIPYLILTRIKQAQFSKTLVCNYGKVWYKINSSWIEEHSYQQYYDDSPSYPSQSTQNTSSSGTSQREWNDWVQQREMQKKTHGSISSYNRNRQQQMRRLRP
jgi:hypothetical protein